MDNHIFDYNSDDYKNFLSFFRNSENLNRHSLFVFAGENETERECAFEEVCRELMSEPKVISLFDIITKDEAQSRENTDRLVESIDPKTELVFCKDGEQLCGVYTGYTYSVVKYATPQERYFLKKIKELPIPVIVELSHEDHLDKTLSRQADAVIKFNAPKAFFDKLFWKLSQIHVNGSTLPSQRPV